MNKVIVHLKKWLLTGTYLCMASIVYAADLPIKFTLDWKFQGPQAAYLVAEAKGYFKEAGIDITIDAGNGSSGSVTRVAGGAYDIGFADINSLIDFVAKNPDQKLKAIFIVYDAPPFAAMTLKKSGIKKPQDLVGKKLGAPVFDSGRKLWPAFAKANSIDVNSVSWESVKPALRETLLVRGGSYDAITGFYFTSYLNLKAAGAKDEDIVSFLYSDYGVHLYGNAIIATDAFLEKNSEKVKGFLGAVVKGWKDTLANPDEAIAFLKKKDALIKSDVEKSRLLLAIKSNVLTDDVKTNGLGDINENRLAQSIQEVVMSLKSPRVPAVSEVFNGSFLPAKSDRMLP